VRKQPPSHSKTPQQESLHRQPIIEIDVGEDDDPFENAVNEKEILV
jgi:hypothetical protein